MAVQQFGSIRQKERLRQKKVTNERNLLLRAAVPRDETVGAEEWAAAEVVLSEVETHFSGADLGDYTDTLEVRRLADGRLIEHYDRDWWGNGADDDCEY